MSKKKITIDYDEYLMLQKFKESFAYSNDYILCGGYFTTYYTKEQLDHQVLKTLEENKKTIKHLQVHVYKLTNIFKRANIFNLFKTKKLVENLLKE